MGETLYKHCELDRPQLFLSLGIWVGLEPEFAASTPSFIQRPSREGGSAVAGSFRPFVLARRPHRTVATERSGEDGSGQNLFSGWGWGGTDFL